MLFLLKTSVAGLFSPGQSPGEPSGNGDRAAQAASPCKKQEKDCRSGAVLFGSLKGSGTGASAGSRPDGQGFSDGAAGRARACALCMPLRVSPLFRDVVDHPNFSEGNQILYVIVHLIVVSQEFLYDFLVCPKAYLEELLGCLADNGIFEAAP